MLLYIKFCKNARDKMKFFCKSAKAGLTCVNACAIIRGNSHKCKEGDAVSTNMEVLRSKMNERNVSIEALSQKIGVDPSTFYRKLKSGGAAFTVGQMHRIAEVLMLTHDEAISIFLW